MEEICSGLTQSENRNKKARRIDNNVDPPGRGNRPPILKFPNADSEQVLLRRVVSAQCGRNRGNERADQQ